LKPGLTPTTLNGVIRWPTVFMCFPFMGYE
jgi:hypothetical protein